MRELIKQVTATEDFCGDTSTQNVSVTYDPSISQVRFEASDNDKIPSWRRYGQGFAKFTAASHTARKFLDLTLTEVATGDKTTVRRQTCICLNPAATWELYEFLREHVFPDARNCATSHTVSIDPE